MSVMLIDDLIRKLRDWAEIMQVNTTASVDVQDLVSVLNKAAEIIKLQHECIVDENNERFKRGLDSVL